MFRCNTADQQNELFGYENLLGKPKRVNYEYIRHGVGNIFMANEPLSGSRLIEVIERKTKKDWPKSIKRIADEMCSKATKITLVMDNYRTH